MSLAIEAPMFPLICAVTPPTGKSIYSSVPRWQVIFASVSRNIYTRYNLYGIKYCRSHVPHTHVKSLFRNVSIIYWYITKTQNIGSIHGHYNDILYNLISGTIYGEKRYRTVHALSTINRYNANWVNSTTPQSFPVISQHATYVVFHHTAKYHTTRITHLPRLGTISVCKADQHYEWAAVNVLNISGRLLIV